MQNTFMVSPMVQTIDLEPGQVYSGSVIVSNSATATEDFRFKMSISPYSVSGTDYTPDFKTQSDWSKIVNWIKLDTTSGVLKPNESKKINFTITVPLDAPVGGQYATIGVSSDVPINNDSNAAIQNVFEMASLIYAKVAGETVRDGKIIKNHVPSFVASGKPTTEISFSNGGNVHEMANVTLTVKNVMTGEVILPKENEENTFETIVMPDSTRVSYREIEGVAALGIYEVKQEVSYIGENSVVSAVMIVCPFWFIALVLLTILSIIGMVFYSRFLRKKKMLKVSQSDIDKNEKNV